MADMKAIRNTDNELTPETTSGDSAQRKGRLLTLVQVTPIISVLVAVTTLIFYLIQRSWQHLMIIGLVMVSDFAFLYARSRMKKEKFTIAAHVFLSIFLIFLPLNTLFWSGATLIYVLGILISVNALALLILPSEERLWSFVLSLFIAALPFVFDTIPLPWQRYDVTQWIFTNLFVYALLGSSIVLAIWCLVAMYQSIRSIGVRLGITLAMGGALVAVTIGLSSMVVEVMISRNHIFDQLSTVADLKEELGKSWIESIQFDLDSLFVEIYEQDRARSLLVETTAVELRLSAEKELTNRLVSMIDRTERFEEIFLLNPVGKVVFSTNADNLGVNYAGESFLVNGLLRNYTDQPRYDSKLNQVLFIVARPVTSVNGNVLGVVAAKVNMDHFEVMVSEGKIGATGVNYFVAEDGTLLNKLRNDARGTSISSDAINNATNQLRSSGTYQDYRGVTVYGVYRWFPTLRAAFITEVDRAEILLNLLPTITIIGLVTLITAAFCVLLSLWIARGISMRLNEFANVATRIAQGDSELTVKVTQDDEIGALARAFNSMTGQLKTLVNESEKRVEERTRGLVAVAEVSRAATSELNPERLIHQVVNLVYEQFNLYYVGLFLVEEMDEGRFAVLRAGTGEAGQVMISEGWRLQVGGESMIGQCISTGLLRVKQTDSDIVPRFDNPYLPDTRSELALPLRYGPRVIGAMTVQSEREVAFDATIMTLFQNMADQVAIVIENARLFAETQTALDRAHIVQQRYQGQAWREYLLGQTIQGFQHRDGNLIPLGRDLLPEVRKALVSGGTIISEKGTLTVPIVQSGQVVGALGFEKSGDDGNWSEDQIGLIQALTEQLVLAAENQRLLDETQMRASREQLTREITERIRSTLDIDTILKTAVSEIGQVMGLDDLTIELHNLSSQSTKE